MSEEVMASVEEKVEEVAENTAEPAESMADFSDKLDKDAFEAPVWDKFKALHESKEAFTIKVESAVKGGAITFIDGVRAFIPQSHLALAKGEEAASAVGRELEVRIIEAEQEGKKLVLSAREVIRDKARQARKAAAESVPVGTVTSGKVETLQPYGAFVRLENGLSGLVHVSQISRRRVKSPEDVLHVGDEVQVKVIAIKDGKLSLSMKALEEPVAGERPEREPVEKVVIPKAENISTNLGDLLKGIKL